MRQYFCILVALLLSVSAQAGVRPLGDKEVDAKQSAGLFVGIRDFKDKRVLPVRYAIDDAIDLAYEFSLGRKMQLVPPDRVVLALSPGPPAKPESLRKLNILLAAGAQRRSAEQAEIRRLLAGQSRRVGRNGILIVSFATHGVSSGDVQYLLARGSDFDRQETTISQLAVSDIVSRHDVARSIILIDACRENLRRDRRPGQPDARSKAAFLRGMTGVEGQVLISGAARGGYAYDDEERRNGVFTATVIDALRCGAAKDHRGFVTVEHLYRYVSREVLRWIQHNKNKTAKRATQMSCEGQMWKMPLSICRLSRTSSASLPRSD